MSIITLNHFVLLISDEGSILGCRINGHHKLLLNPISKNNVFSMMKYRIHPIYFL